MIQGPVSPAPSPGAQPSVGAASVYGLSQIGSSAPAFGGAYSQLPSSAGPSHSIMKEEKFPERVGQPDCKYYMRTGDCKYGSSCRYNHPPDWIVSHSNSALSPLGLPLRPVCLLFHSSLFHLGIFLIISFFGSGDLIDVNA